MFYLTGEKFETSSVVWTDFLTIPMPKGRGKRYSIELIGQASTHGEMLVVSDQFTVSSRVKYIMPAGSISLLLRDLVILPLKTPLQDFTERTFIADGESTQPQIKIRVRANHSMPGFQLNKWRLDLRHER